MLDLDPEALKLIITQMVILILSIAVHEFGHAKVADMLGDRLPRSEGRVTLNPLAHADPLGTLLLPGVALFMSGGMSMGFGWGKPVNVQPVSFSRRWSMDMAHLFVAAAGPLMNVAFGVFIAGIYAALYHGGILRVADHWQLMRGFQMAITMNFILFFLNLVPVPPLDGGTVARGLIPAGSSRRSYEQIAQYGLFIAMAVIMIPTLARIFLWPAGKLYGVVASVFGLP